MTKSQCYLNLVLIFLVGIIFTVISNLILPDPDSIQFSIVLFLPGLIIRIAPALIILLVGLIIQWFKKPAWKTIFIIAWIIFLFINIIAIIGNLMLLNSN